MDAYCYKETTSTQHNNEAYWKSSANLQNKVQIYFQVPASCYFIPYIGNLFSAEVVLFFLLSIYLGFLETSQKYCVKQ